jgi:hypothetical protein
MGEGGADGHSGTPFESFARPLPSRPARASPCIRAGGRLPLRTRQRPPQPHLCRLTGASWIEAVFRADQTDDG